MLGKKRFEAGCWSDEGSCKWISRDLILQRRGSWQALSSLYHVQERTLQTMLSGRFAFRCLALATTTVIMVPLHCCCYRSASVPGLRNGRNEGVHASFVPCALVSRVGTDGYQFDDTATKQSTTASRLNTDTIVFYIHMRGVNSIHRWLFWWLQDTRYPRFFLHATALPDPPLTALCHHHVSDGR
jgi:hypothetical protein